MKYERWIDQHATSVGQRKKSESPIGIKSMTFQKCGRHSFRGHGFDSCWGLRFFACPMLVSCWSIHLSHFITEFKIRHLYSLINIKYTLMCKIGAFQIPDNFFHLYHLIPAQGHTASVKEESLLVQLSWPWLFHCHERVFWELLHNKHQGAN